MTIRSQVLINEMKHHETKDLLALYLDTYTHATDAVFKRQLADSCLQYRCGQYPNLDSLLGRTNLWSNHKTCLLGITNS